MLRHQRTEKNSEAGIALVIVLWVLILLSAVALSFTILTKTEGLAAFAFKNDVENKYLAEGGIQRGIMEIFHRSLNKNQTKIIEGQEVLQTDGTVYYGKTSGGSYALRLTDESGKININALTDANSFFLINLLIHLGVEDKIASTITDSILDWKDADELHRLNGAESDYYLSLDNPYKAKNARLDTIEEMLLIKGMTTEILYGDGKKPGLTSFVTVHSNITRINVNAAPKAILMSLPGMTENIATNLIAARASRILNSQDIQEIMGAIYPPISSYLSLEDSRIFTVRATGFKDDEKKGYPVKAIVTVDGIKTYRTIYYKSPDYERH